MHGQHYPAFETSSPLHPPPTTVRVPERFHFENSGPESDQFIHLYCKCILFNFSRYVAFINFKVFQLLLFLVLKFILTTPSPTTKNIVYVWTFRSLQIFTRYWRLPHQIPYLTRVKQHYQLKMKFHLTCQSRDNLICSVRYNSHTCPVPKLILKEKLTFSITFCVFSV